MSAENTANTSSVPKWAIVLGLGAAGAIGFGYWYLKINKKPSSHANSISKNETGTKKMNGKDTIPSDKSHIQKELTPLEKSLQYKNEGNDFFKRGKYEEAIQSYNKALGICPEEYKIELAIYYQNRAAAYEKLQEWHLVIADCSEALKLNSKYEKALMRRANAEENIKDWENCLDDITCVCLLQKFQNQSTLTMADRVLKELGKKHAAEVMKNRKLTKPSRNTVKSYYSSFSEDPVYKKLIQVGEPMGDGEVRGFLKAKLAFASGQYDEIIPSCTDEINSSESDSLYCIEALSLRATFYFLSGFLGKSSDDLTVIIETEDCDYKIKVNALIKRASIFMQSEKPDECLSDFKRAAELGPDISDVFHHRGQVKLLMYNTNEAIDDFKRAVELNPNFSIAYVQKCYSDYRFAIQTQNVELLMKSLSDFRVGMEKFPNCPETFVLFAQVLTEKRDYEEADDLYNKAIEIDETNAAVYVHRGLLVLQWKSDSEKAVNLMREAIKIDDKCQFAYETLGTLEVQRGNLDVSINLFNKAIELARSEMEIVHLCSLRDAAVSQLRVTNRLGIPGPLNNL